MEHHGPRDPGGAFHAPFRRVGALAGLFLLCAVSPGVAPGQPPDPGPAVETDLEQVARQARRAGGEALRVRWRLTGFLGALAGLFVPRQGDGLLTFVPEGDDRLRIEMLLTAPRRRGEHFLYGAEIDRARRSTSRVWSSTAFRNRSKRRDQEIRDGDVIDFASAMYHLRWNPPREPRRMTIWNNGSTYRVEVAPLGTARRKVAGERVEVRGYGVRGIKTPGERTFKERFSVWFAEGDGAPPVEIVGRRGAIRVEMEIVDDLAGSSPAR